MACSNLQVMALICRSGNFFDHGFDIGGLGFNIVIAGGYSLAGTSGELQQTFGQDIVGRQRWAGAVVQR